MLKFEGRKEFIRMIKWAGFNYQIEKIADRNFADYPPIFSSRYLKDR